jgi:hypothetical protein
LITINAKAVAKAGMSISTPSNDRALSKAATKLIELKLIPTHNEFHQAWCVAVKQITSHSQQAIRQVLLSQIRFLFNSGVTADFY